MASRIGRKTSPIVSVSSPNAMRPSRPCPSSTSRRCRLRRPRASIAAAMVSVAVAPFARPGRSFAERAVLSGVRLGDGIADAVARSTPDARAMSWAMASSAVAVVDVAGRRGQRRHRVALLGRR